MNSVTMSLTNVINFFIIAAGIGIVGLSMIQTRRAPIRKDVKKYFMTFMWMIILYITMHLTRQMLDGNPGNAVRVAIRTVTFIEFLASGFMTLMLVTMILFTAVSDSKAKRHVQVLIVMLGIHVLLLVVSQFNGMYYDFDGNNVYFRGKLYILSNLIPLLMIIQGIDRKLPFEDIAEARDMTLDDLLDNVEAIIASGTSLNIDYYIKQQVDSDILEDIYTYFKEEAYTDSLNDALKALGPDYTELEIRLVRIKFISELGN